MYNNSQKSSGTSIWTTEVAAKYPNSKFYAVDFTTPNSNNDNITFISCDIYQILPFPDNEFDYVFSRDKTDFFAKDKFQVFLFEIFRVLKPGGWLEIDHSLPTDDAYGPALTRISAAYASWHKERGIDFDLIIRLEDYLQMTGKTEFISSQIVKIPPGDNYLGEFICEAGSYYINFIRNFWRLIWEFHLKNMTVWQTSLKMK
ncbi:S-adenosyl-L-methionine-dependent methyltransferase [Gigaspora margarita]|uniref:S-adenosyl-L-methionine-dependent methyltransferase n=1 Tax=Gigaspora margarita TaxID=4874 RepID=A0A8H4A1A5_GIGMA|nr:S-adenosyl-L-methionine-dependent methyltransferase [Gigaspora margarita]